MKNPSKKYLKNKLDTFWSKIVRLRANDKCEISDSKKTQAHHLIGRRNLAVRWDLDNGVSLCFAHHYGYWSAHQNPFWFGKKMIKLRGSQFIDDLVARSIDPVKFTISDYQTKIKEFEGVLKEYERG